jgi:hypothetical protein
MDYGHATLLALPLSSAAVSEPRLAMWYLRSRSSGRSPIRSVPSIPNELSGFAPSEPATDAAQAIPAIPRRFRVFAYSDCFETLVLQMCRFARVMPMRCSSLAPILSDAFCKRGKHIDLLDAGQALKPKRPRDQVQLRLPLLVHYADRYSYERTQYVTHCAHPIEAGVIRCLLALVRIVLAACTSNMQKATELVPTPQVDINLVPLAYPTSVDGVVVLYNRLGLDANVVVGREAGSICDPRLL